MGTGLKSSKERRLLSALLRGGKLLAKATVKIRRNLSSRGDLDGVLISGRGHYIGRGPARSKRDKGRLKEVGATAAPSHQLRKTFTCG